MDWSQKHYRTHCKPVRCPFPSCEKRQAEPCDMERHVWSYHKNWAVENGYRDLSGACERCGQKFTRRDNINKHICKRA